MVSATSVGAHRTAVSLVARAAGSTRLYLSVAGYKLPVWQLAVVVR